MGNWGFISRKMGYWMREIGGFGESEEGDCRNKGQTLGEHRRGIQGLEAGEWGEDRGIRQDLSNTIQ